MALPKKPTQPTSTTPSVVPPVDLKQLPKKGVVATGKVADDKTSAAKEVKAPKTAVTTAATAAAVPTSTPDAVDSEAVPVNADGTPVKDNLVSTIIEKVNTLFTSFKEVQALLKVLSKEYDKQQKIIEKAQKKRQNAKNSPSGFAKPNKISDELCDFIGVPHGTEKSRTDITRFINTYVKEHNLNKPENKRFILPDEKLKKILNVGDKEDINYFILQKLISHHFPPSASKQAQAAA
jgi:chromatin remodeling complex protein RSC6